MLQQTQIEGAAPPEILDGKADSGHHMNFENWSGYCKVDVFDQEPWKEYVRALPRHRSGVFPRVKFREVHSGRMCLFADFVKSMPEECFLGTEGAVPPV